MLTRRLWAHLDDAGRTAVRSALEVALTERYRLIDDVKGGFSSYLGSPAEVDGTAMALGFIEATMRLPGTPERARLWGDAAAPAVDIVSIASPAAIELPGYPSINSFHLYANGALPVDDLDTGRLLAVLYPSRQRGGARRCRPEPTSGLYRRYASASFGNWSAADDIRRSTLHPDPAAPAVSVLRVNHMLGEAAGDVGKGTSELTLVGYDVFQRPVLAHHYRVGN